MVVRAAYMWGVVLLTAVPVLGHGAVVAAPGSFISGLYNTGIDRNADGIDDHYRLSSLVSDVAYVGSGVAASWLSNSSSAASKWLTPAPNALQSYDAKSPGLYEYSLSFDLTGYREESARLAARWATDNFGEVTLNGLTLGSSDAFTRWTSFEALSGFRPGLNTLTFSVTNYQQLTGNPTGLRVEFLNSFVSPVPEPAEWLTLSAGTLLIVLQLRRKAGAARTA